LEVKKIPFYPISLGAVSLAIWDLGARWRFHNYERVIIASDPDLQISAGDKD